MALGFPGTTSPLAARSRHDIQGLVAFGLVFAIASLLHGWIAACDWQANALLPSSADFVRPPGSSVSASRSD